MNSYLTEDFLECFRQLPQDIWNVNIHFTNSAQSNLRKPKLTIAKVCSIRPKGQKIPMQKDERYKYTGMPLTGEIAAKILSEWTETTERHISVWMEIVSTHHISRGGLPAKGNSEQIIRSALSTLRRFGQVENSGQWWTIRTSQKNDTLKNSADAIKKVPRSPTRVMNIKESLSHTRSLLKLSLEDMLGNLLLVSKQS